MSNKSELKADVQSKLKKANARLRRMRSKGLGKLSVIPLALREHAKILGTDAATFKMGRNPSVQTLEKLSKQLDRFLNSKWTTEQGRQYIYEKRFKTFATKESLLLDRDTALKLFDIFSTDVYEKAVDRGLLDSRQTIELLKEVDANNSSMDFEKAIQKVFEMSQAKEYDVANAFEDIIDLLN